MLSPLYLIFYTVKLPSLLLSMVFYCDFICIVPKFDEDIERINGNALVLIFLGLHIERQEEVAFHWKGKREVST